jgi:hypothetical protein
MYQVVINHDWSGIDVERRIWHFSPVQNLEDAESQAASMLLRGVCAGSQIGLACTLKRQSK